MIEKPTWLKYALYYPEEDEDGYDGVHAGGIKGIREDAPDEVKREFKKYNEIISKGIKL